METWKWIVLALGVAAMVGGTAVAAGYGHRGQRGERINAHINHVLDEIDATPQQRQVINQVKDDLMAKFRAKAQQRGQDRAQWISVLTADALDVGKLNAEADRRADEMRAFAKDQLIPALKTVHDVLTPAQRQKLAQLVEQHHGKLQGGFGGGDAP